LLFLLFATAEANAATRRIIWDDELVKDSDFIVIAHLKDNHFQAVTHKESRSYEVTEYSTTLVVTKVLKGQMRPGDLSVIIHHGLRPVVLKENPSIEEQYNPRPADQNTDMRAAIAIQDNGQTLFPNPISDDVRSDHLWFLRIKSRAPAYYEEITDKPGLWTPEGIQPAKLEPYYRTILAGDADAVGAYAGGDPNSFWSRRVHFCQAVLQIDEAAKISDPNARCNSLLAIYVKEGPYTPAGDLALKDVLACGSLGAAKLIPLFKNPPTADFERGTILSAWWKTGFQESVPIIIDWLSKEDQRWTKWTKADQIYASREGPKGGEPYHDPRSVSFRNMYSAIEVLDDFHATESKPLIQRIRNRWAPAAPFLPNNDFLKRCDDTLADFP
jgi:hypothetical protein